MVPNECCTPLSICYRLRSLIRGMNLTAISGQSRLGRCLRLPLRLVPKNAVLPVLLGPLRGAKWIAASSTHGCWLGTFEYNKQKLFASLITPDSVVYDIGANVGLYSLLAARRGAQLTVACEPDPANILVLKRHLELNCISTVLVEQAAACEVEGVEGFQPNRDMGALGGSSLMVRAVTLDSLLLRYPPPTLVKIDVEGAEWRVLQGATETLKYHPAVFVAFDDPEHTKAPGAELMVRHGYECQEISGNESLFLRAVGRSRRALPMQ